jgi:phosphoglycolate phosphatase
VQQQDSIVFFDFDGVIADSLDHAVATMRKLDPTLTKRDYVSWFHNNIMDHPFVQEWKTRFVEHYETDALHQPLFPGMKNVIETVSTRHVLVIVSSGVTSIIKSFLDRHRLGEHFADVLGSDVHASKHVKMTRALTQHNIAASQSVMVTDTLGDIREATQAGVAAIGVLWGFHDAATLTQGNPAAIAASPEELPQHIADLL